MIASDPPFSDSRTFGALPVMARWVKAYGKLPRKLWPEGSISSA
jgi:hypothetical protein